MDTTITSEAISAKTTRIALIPHQVGLNDVRGSSREIAQARLDPLQRAVALVRDKRARAKRRGMQCRVGSSAGPHAMQPQQRTRAARTRFRTERDLLGIAFDVERLPRARGAGKGPLVRRFETRH